MNSIKFDTQHTHTNPAIECEERMTHHKDLCILSAVVASHQLPNFSRLVYFCCHIFRTQKNKKKNKKRNERQIARDSMVSPPVNCRYYYTLVQLDVMYVVQFSDQAAGMCGCMCVCVHT